MQNRTVMLCLALLVPSAAAAQTTSLAPGTRVRVTSTTLHLDHVEGVVRELHGDTLVMVTPYQHIVLGRIREDTATRNVPLDAVDGIQLSNGKASDVGDGAVIGGLVGGGLGFLLGVVAVATSHPPDCPSQGYFCFDFSVGPEAIPEGMFGGALIGLLAGTFIGALSSHDVWQDVAVPSPSTAVTLHAGRGPLGGQSVGIGMAFRF